MKCRLLPLCALLFRHPVASTTAFARCFPILSPLWHYTAHQRTLRTWAYLRRIAAGARCDRLRHLQPNYRDPIRGVLLAAGGHTCLRHYVAGCYNKDSSQGK